MPNYDDTLAQQRRRVTEFIAKCADESQRIEKEPRRAQNIDNWNYFHGTIDWSHKGENDLCVHLHKIGVAAERVRAKFKQALMNYDKWITLERKYMVPNTTLPDFAAKNLLTKQLDRANAKTKISDAILCGALESRMTLKVGSKFVTKPRFVAKGGKLVREEAQVWQLDLPVLRFEQFLPDPYDSSCPLYEIEEAITDYYKVLELASDEPSADKPFRMEAVKRLDLMPNRDQEEALKATEGNPMKDTRLADRKPVLLQNFYGTILNDDGSVFEWENEDGKKMPLKNVVCVVGNETELLMDPRRNIRWSGKSPFIYSDPIHTPGDGRKAILDAGTEANRALDELFALMLEGARRAAHNLTWYRKDWIADKKKLTGGIQPFDTIAISNSAPPNAVPVGTVKTGDVPQEAMTMQQVLDRVFAENVISNQIDLSGSLPGKQVRATELVQADTAIKDVFDSMAGDIEDVFIENLAEESFLEIIQHIDEMDQDEVLACFHPREDLGEQFLALSPSERFEQVYGIFRFKGKGMRGLISNMGKAQALINLVNTIMANPITAGQVESQISAAKLVLEIVQNMGIDLEKIQPDAQERQLIEQKQLVREQAIAQAEAAGQQTAQPAQGGSPSQQGAATQFEPGSGQQGL